MKITCAKKTLRRLFCAGVMICFMLSGGLSAQTNNFSVIRGERPPIDLSQVNSNAYEPGVLLIKLGSQFTGQLEQQPAMILENGSVRFNIRALDELNDAQKVKGFRQHFRHAALKNTFTDKHKAWGFHLWYRLEFDTKADIVQLVEAYQALKEVSVAEPEYQTMLIGNVADNPLDDGQFTWNITAWTPNDPQYSNQWHYHNTGQQSGTPDADIDLPEAWEIEKGLSAVVVAIVDGGIQFNHPDLAANMWQNGSGHYGYNFVAGSTTIEPHDHGTHVAGTVAAVNSNGIGVAGVAGGSGSGDGVRLMSCQVFSSSSSGGFHLAPVYAADNGASISQNSWGYTTAGAYNQSALDAIDYFNINGGGSAMSGGITIFAAGNSNSSANFYPGYYSGTLAVAGMNNQDKKGWYSNYGSWVDISAPGGETNTVTARGVLSSVTSNGYAYYQGTSMACPHVSGVAALLLSHALRNSVPLNNADLRELLVDNVDNHYPANPSFLNQLGSGRLNANLALLALQNLASGVLNPANLSATAVSTSQINLSWVRNPDNNNVMLAWSTDGVFGTPVEGVVYNAGASLPGGGTVLYRGSNTTFNHVGLDNATYYFYKAFSYNASNSYSAGKEANAATFCGTISALPITQDFNSSSTIPICWEVTDNQGNGQVWQVGIHGSGLTGTTGNYAYLNSDDFGSGNSQNSDLLSPLLNLSAYTNVSISFSHYFREYTGSTATVAYSINNGTTWTTIQSWTTSTVNPATFTQIIPALSGQASVRIKWNYTGTWGYYWDVDDIQITGAAIGSPYADFTAEPLQTHIGESVTFTNASGGGSFSSWQWTFGEGANPANAIGVGPHTVIYSTAGNKTVSLVVDDIYTETKANYIAVSEISTSSSATYTQGDIPTDFGFRTTGQSSTCPGILSVNIPSGAMITSVDVSYQMTGLNSGWKSEQRSQLRCVSPGGTSEQVVFSGIGNSTGSQSYSRTGLNIANGVTVGGNIVFELHAGRTWGGSGCNSTYNKVDNNSWTITVFYEPPMPCLPPTSLVAINIGAYSAEIDWTPGGSESEWNVEWGSLGFSPTYGSKINGITEKPYTITNLQPGTTYDFYVQAVCDGNPPSTSEWVGPYRFTTKMVYIIAASPNNQAFGSATGGGIYEHGALVALTATPATGYHFINWTQGGLEVATDPVYIFNAINNRVLVANFAINTYSIMALPNDPAFGSVTGGGSYEHGELVNLSAIPATGYHFVNWTENGVEVETDPVYIFSALENRTLVANFALNAYSITALPNDPAFGSVTGGGSYEHGELVNLSAIPATGYHFVNWTEGGVEVETNPDYIFSALENRILVANLAINAYSITALPNDPAFGSITGSGSYEHGEVVNLSAIPATGYHFANWTESGVEVETNPVYIFIASENRTLLANFAINTYSITALPNDPALGTVTGGGDYEHGELVNLSAMPAAGYHFVNWTEGGVEVETNPVYIFIASENRTLLANFAINTYSITALPNDPALGTVTGGGDYEHGEVVNLSAIPVAGYHFVNWTEGGVEVETNPVYIFSALENRTLVANFAINTYSITALPNDPAFGLVTGGGDYEHGELVNLSAIPAAGYHFVNWTEGGMEVETNPVYIFSALENRTLVANFAINTYSITALPNDPAFGSVTGGGDYEYGEIVSLLATPLSGYHFVNWTEEGIETSTDAGIMFAAVENRNLVANFELSVPLERWVQNENIGNGEEECFDATGTIIVSNVTVENGGTAHFIAGESITIAGGFNAKQGAYVWARISDDYCSQFPSMLNSEEVINVEILPSIKSDDKFFRVFPNPTTGNMRLMFNDGVEASTVMLEVYNVVGEKLQHFELSGQMQYDFDLSGLPGGIYILKIQKDKVIETEKIIKH